MQKRISSKLKPRIIAGKYKGYKLDVPSTARPITDRVKKAMFDTLTPYLQNAYCLDAFAGSGSVGIEALSQGVANVDFVESNRKTTETLKSNLKNIKGVSNKDYSIYNMFIFTFLNNFKEKKYDLIFIDPPFRYVKELRFHKFLNVCKDSTILILKLNHKDVLADDYLKGFDILFTKKYGINKLIYLKKSV